MLKNMRKMSLVLILFIVAALVGCTGVNESGEKAQLSGTIYNEHKELFTGSAIVTLDGKAGLLEGSKYSFTDVSPGTRKLVVEAEGYNVFTKKITFKSGEKKTEDVYLDNTPKIAVVTGSEMQNAEGYHAAKNMATRYPASVEHLTYPDNFWKEQEAVIDQISQLASDPMTKAIVVCEAIPGTIEAFTKIRDERDDIVLIVGVTHEDPDVIREVADLAMEIDQLGRGRSIAQLAGKMGAKKILHYSFPRHMSLELIKERHDNMKAEAERLGMEFIDVSAPDPNDGDLQQFILEDIPSQVKSHGKDIAFFGTNCAMMEPAIKASLEAGIIFPEQCCPSPFHGYPGALGITDHNYDVDYTLGQIRSKVKESGNTDRMATWAVPPNMLFVEAGVKLALKNLQEDLDFSDKEALEKAISETTGVDVSLTRYGTDGNFYLAIVESVIF